MATFVDDFDRANGALGGNWTTISGTVNISGNAAVGNNASASYNSTVSDSGRLEASLHCTSGHTSGYRAGPMVKSAGASNAGFALSIQDNARPYTLQLLSQGSIGGTVLASVELDIVLPVMYELRLVWDAGHLSGYYNGELLIEYDSELYYNNTYTGFVVWGATCPVLDFTAVGGAAVAFTVSPLVIGNYATTVPMTATGTNTAWTSGTPGTPAFTVDHGSISDQTVDTTTTAHWTYDPGLYLGPVLFTDPSTGATCAAVVTSDPETVPVGSQCPFDQDFIDTANATVIGDNKGLPTLESILVPASEGWGSVILEAALVDIWYAHFRPELAPPSQGTGTNINAILWDILNGAIEHTSEDNVFSLSQTTLTELRALQSAHDTLISASEWTLQDILDLVMGTGDRNLTEVYELVAALDNQAVLDAIAALRGDTTSTVADIFTSMGQLRTLNTWTLGNVKTWIEAIEGGDVDLSPVLTAISNLSDQLGDVETAILNNIAGLGLVMTALQLTVGGIDTTVGTVADVATDILDLVEDLPTEFPGGTTSPVWPGVGNVTLGDELELVNGMEIDGPMHGLLLTITGTPVRTQKYVFGDIVSWSRVGSVIFATDNGDYERSQTFSLDAQVLVPTTMAQAASAIVRVQEGWEGTVQAWTQNA